MMWKKEGEGVYAAHLLEDRIIPDDAFGCVLLGGEPVVLSGEIPDEMFQETEAVVELRADVYEASYPEEFSNWRLKYEDGRMVITESNAIPCWRMTDP